MGKVWSSWTWDNLRGSIFSKLPGDLSIVGLHTPL